jgi:hypothetical protein
MSYPGGKNGAGVYQTIINLMPPHPVYIEPFLGGGAILRLKQPAALNIGIDLDAAAIARINDWIRAGSRNGKNDDTVRIGRNADAEPKSCFPTTAENGDAGQRPTPEKTVTDRQFRFHRGDGISFLTFYPLSGPELVYCDPPYMPETLKTRCRYRYDLATEQHAELLEICCKLPCKVMISGYWSKLYADVLGKWNSIQFEVMTRGGSFATEWLWFNFASPVALHDYSYVGSNYRERDNLKRKKLRWVNRLKRMPALEKQCLLEAIASTGGSGDSAGCIVNFNGGRRR